MSTEFIYDMVTQKILEKLDQGVVSWRRPWNMYGAVNWKSQKPYRGINTMLLEPGEYASYKQIKEAGGKLKKGAKKEVVVFWKPLKRTNKETQEEETFYMLRYYRVYNIATHVEGLQSKQKNQQFDHDPIEEADKIINQFMNGPKIKHVPGRACYHKKLDVVSIPALKDYKVPEEYYSTAFHELVHSTGHHSRLDRPELIDAAEFGDSNYSREELTAEFGAAMLCGVSGIDNTIIDNSAAYIAGWSRKLKEEPKWALQAAGKAQKAADHILGVSFGDDKEEE